MFISIDTWCLKNYGSVEKVIALLKESGFDAYDYTFGEPGFADEFFLFDDYLERAKKLRAYADGLGIACNQTHAPFPTWLPSYKKIPSWMGATDHESYNAKMFKDIVRALEVSAILGAKVCVVHPANDASAEENAEFYKRLEPVARRVGVKIGLENMWNRTPDGKNCAAACSHHEDFAKHLSLLPADVFVACLDIGHAEMSGLDTSAVEMIYALKDRLAALHIHDNDKVNDSHRLPYTMAIDFEQILTALKEVNYRGDVTFETSYFALPFPLETYPAVASLLASVAKYMRSRLN